MVEHQMYTHKICAPPPSKETVCIQLPVPEHLLEIKILIKFDEFN